MSEQKLTAEGAIKNLQKVALEFSKLSEEDKEKYKILQIGVTQNL